jgi:uncharacterized protein YbjQ (UPF0145 family)
MEPLLQNTLVGVIVMVCVVFSAWRLMSPKLRLKTLEFLAPAAEKLGANGLVTRLRTQTVAQLAAGCSACSHNKTAVHHPSGHSRRT